MNAVKGTSLSLNIECCGTKMSGDYNGVPMRFSRNQLPPSIANSSETDLKKRNTTKKNPKESTNNVTRS